MDASQCPRFHGTFPEGPSLAMTIAFELPDQPEVLPHALLSCRRHAPVSRSRCLRHIPRDAQVERPPHIKRASSWGRLPRAMKRYAQLHESRA